MRRSINILFAIAVSLSLFSCEREALTVDQVKNDGTVIVGDGPANLSLTLGTKADAMTLADAMNGDAFENVLVIITNSSNKVVARKYEEYTDYPSSKDLEFDGLDLGTYTIYAYANIDNTDWTGSTISENSLAVGDDFTPDSELNVLSGKNTPSRPSDKGMLLTGMVEFNVGVGFNSATVELLRPVVDFNVYVNNKTEYPITLTELSFSDFNASRTYLLDHRTDEGIPTLPSGNTYRSLPDFTGSLTLAAHESDKLAYSTLLYENAASSYTLSATMGIAAGNTATQIGYSSLESMEVGDTKTVLMANPTKTDGYFLGYNGGVKSEATGVGGSATNSLGLNNKATSLASNTDYQFKITKVKETKSETTQKSQEQSVSNGSTGYSFTEITGESETGFGKGYIDKSTTTTSSNSSKQCVIKVTFKGYTSFSIKLTNYYSWTNSNGSGGPGGNDYSVIHVTNLDATNYTTGSAKNNNDKYFLSSNSDGTCTFSGLDANTEHSFWINHEYKKGGPSGPGGTTYTTYAKIWLPTIGTYDSTTSVDYYYYTIQSLSGSYGPTGTTGTASWSTTLMNYTPAEVSTSSSNLITTNNLVSFKNPSNKYLNAEGAASSLAYTDTEGDYTSWILYEIGSTTAKTASIEGSQLKIIDNVTSQVTPLTYMVRNQKLNIIINAYYNESTSQFNFEVDNAYWTNGHTAAHTFK